MSKISADAVISLADAEVGYLEKATNSSLDDKTANAGKSNYTKYARDMVNNIGAPFANGCAWCGTFTEWLFFKAFGKEKAKQLLHGWSAYTPTMANYFKAHGALFNNPKAGDLIFFRNTERICHVGIVYKVDSTNVYTIEGNTSSGSNVVIPNGGGVFKKLYSLNNTKIAGYGRPKYDSDSNAVIPRKSSAYSYGIDLSANNGDINFSEVKNDNVEFAILRCTTKDNSVDKKFEQYYNACKTYEINTAVYKYSYARTEVEAIEEADKLIEILGKRNMKIWYDLENANQVQAIGKDGITKVASAFLKTCKQKGYQVGIYCNLNWYKNYISNELKKNYDLWIARYGQNNGMIDEKYKPNVDEIGWQYTSLGKVAGINGNVDLDVMYKV